MLLDVLKIMLGIALAIGAFAAAIAFIYWMLQPIRKIEKTVRPKSQFLIGDIFWLMLIVQLSLGATSTLAKNWGEQRGVAIIIGGYFVLSAGALWWYGVCLLTALGIFHTGRRAVFLVVILPVAAIGAIATAVTVTFSAVSTFNNHPASLALLPLIPLVCFAGRVLTVWVLSGATPTPVTEAVTVESSSDDEVSGDCS